ncbi:MAG: hypothetical protein E6I95_07340 [Chloroflexi bacterium]|nr:MAG: hypothetical protein E6I95_07340 [Chloroflexota bacterium]
MNSMRRLLELERETELHFVAHAEANESNPKGWPASLLMFHLAQWRGRMRQALDDVRAGRPQTLPPENTDEFNDAELPDGAGVSLKDAAARSDIAIAAIIDLYDAVGERPFSWRISRTTTEAVIRNSYIHPRQHMYEYLLENGDSSDAHRLVEEGVNEMRQVGAPPITLGIVIYNLACVRVGQGRTDEALPLLEEALDMHPDLRDLLAGDEDLEPLKNDARFRALAAET